MKNAIIWGAGKIGRGFVADLLHEGGYFIDFVDIDAALVDGLNTNGKYSIFKADASGIRKDVIEGGFRAHHTSEDISGLFLSEDCLIDVAVFKNDLDAVADMLAPYITMRAEKLPMSKMDIITNVNMVSPELHFRKLLEQRLTGAAREYLDNNIGVSGIFMMCISPDAQSEMLEEDPLAVYNNGFFEQGVDDHAFKGKKPDAPRMRLSQRLEAEEARKLYTLNMAHCAMAYLGQPKGHATSFEAVNDKELAAILSGALDEAGIGLKMEFGFTDAETAEWKKIIFDLLLNPYMADPLSRLGADSRRKLSGNDRLMMPAKLCLKAGAKPMNLAKIIRAGYNFENDDPGTQHVRSLVVGTGLSDAICQVGSIDKGSELHRLIFQEECKMLTKCVRLHGQNDLRLDTIELPAIKDNEILVKVVSDSICMSSYKAASQGSNHKRVPNDIAEKPIIVGHEFCGEILEVGAKWADQFKVGEKFGIQPAIDYHGSLQTPGYSFQYVGGDTQYAVIIPEVMEQNCLLHYAADEYFYASLAEPLSCIIGTFHAQYHTKLGSYVHEMGIVEGGNMAILAGVGPMGLGAIDYAIHCDRKPGLLVVTDINQERLDRAATLYTVEEAAKNGVKLVYMNTAGEDSVDKLMALTDGKGYDDVMVFAPVASLVEQGDAILGFDGCLNFFAGPTNTAFSANFNFYNVHYGAHHLVGTSGGNTADMIEALDMIAAGTLKPAGMVTHIGGLNSVAETTLNLPKIPGGKKLVYTHIDMPMTAISDFAELGKTDPMFAELAKICEKNNGLWSGEAEKYLLANAKAI